MLRGSTCTGAGEGSGSGGVVLILLLLSTCTGGGKSSGSGGVVLVLLLLSRCMCTDVFVCWEERVPVIVKAVVLVELWGGDVKSTASNIYAILLCV